MKTYYGVDGKPAPVRDGGYAEATMAYDARGSLIEESYFGADGKPAHDDGVVTIKYSYDDQGRQTHVTYLDAQAREVAVELVVRNVIPGGAGAQAGLVSGDHLLTYNGEKVTSDKQLDGLTKGANIYRVVTVRRGSQVLTFEIPAGSFDVNLGLARVEVETPATNVDTAPAASTASSP
jgi:YD repeat-containing protein